MPEAWHSVHVSDNTYRDPNSFQWFSHRSSLDHYAGRTRFFFIAPQDGWYRFLVNADDISELMLHFADGTYELLQKDNSYHGNYENFSIRCGLLLNFDISVDLNQILLV